MHRNKTIKTFFALVMVLLFANVVTYGYIDQVFAPGPNHKTKPIPYSEIGIDTIQEYIINYERNLVQIYGYDPYNYLAGMSLRAFKAWSEKFTGKDIPVIVFKIQEPDYKINAHPWWEFEDYMEDFDFESVVGKKHKICLNDYDDDDAIDLGDGYEYDHEQKRIVDSIKTKTYFEELPFKSYPQYGDCNVEKLLSEKNIIVNVSTDVEFMDIIESRNITISALIPNDSEDSTFTYQTFYYYYRPRIMNRYWVTKKESKEHADKRRQWFIDKMIEKPEMVISTDGYIPTNAFSDHLEWRLWELDPSDSKTVRFTQENMPKTIEDLFNYLRKLR